MGCKKGLEVYLFKANAVCEQMCQNIKNSNTLNDFTFANL